ncbi:MAG: zinc-ribbon domain-containing protein [Deltaproteobacteria bacterium]|nr:zinc-ribbon domain-containing protein [Deltaproteobacteria bacterium]
MILTCNECGAGFNFDEHLLKETGSKVRCSKCKKVFTAYPPSDQHEKTDFTIGDEQPVAPGTESSPESSNDDGIELKNIDLEEIEGILGMDNEPDAGSDSTQGSGELDFDLTTKEDEGEATLESTLESEKTEELDLSDMDNILKEDGSPEGTLALDLSDMDNILKVEDDATKESELSQEEDPGFELDLDLDTGEDEDEAATESTLGLEKTEELDLSGFDNILDKDEEPETKSVPADEPTGLDLDFDIDDISDEDGSDFELDETVNLDLSDMDNILEVEDEEDKESESSEEDNFDFELDFGSDKEEVVSDSEPVIESEKTEDLDLSDFENILEEDEDPETESVSADEPTGLDLDFDIDIDDSSDEDDSDFELEETVELDLSEMDNVLEIDDDESKNTESALDEDLDFNLDLGLEDEKEQDDKIPESTVAEAEVSDDLDFELDLDIDMDEGEGTDSTESELKPKSELEGIDELDLSDMEDGTDELDKQTTEDNYDEKTEELDFELDLVTEEGEDSDNDSLAVELGDAEEFDLSDLDSVLDEEDKQIRKDVPTEEIEELELDIEDDIADASDGKASEIQFASTEKFDLSDIDQMIDTDEKTKPQDEEPEEIELDFEIEGNAQDLFGKDETIEEQAVPRIEEKLDDTFDMGALKDESDAEDADDFTDSKKLKTYPSKRKPAGKKRLSGPMRILLIFVLLVGGAFAAHEILNSMGIKISVTDAIREIPFVGDLVKPDVKDVGNLYVNIFEKTVNGRFVDNPKIGTLFVVTGQIRNEYEHPRRFIRITGKIYKKGRALVKTETIYCGNLLSETELKSLNHVGITKRLKNRFGDKRINVKVNKGQALQFMIVFPNVPSGLEEYSVQVAGSEKP